MKKIFATLFLGLTFNGYVNAQSICTITITPMDTTVCIGDSVLITSVSNLLNAGQTFNFNSASIPTGWSAAGGTSFSTPCGSSPTNTPYYWASSAGNGTPGITSASYDVFCGGVLSFDMVFALQAGSAPCEGPDEQDEGVSLQYSLDGGATWITIVYYSPGGFELPTNPNTSTSIVAAGQATPYTTWSTFSVPIPLAAQTTSTAFRWVQLQSSGTCCDNWGIENIVINATGTPCGSNTVVNWDSGLNDTDSFWAVPTGDTTFQAMVYDTLGNYQCTSQIVTISVFPDAMTYSLVDTAYSYCPTFSPTVGVTGIGNSTGPYTYNWSTPSTTNPTILPSTGLQHDTITYYVTIQDGCNYVRQDSVVLVINQLLAVDTMYSFPASACESDGAVSGVVLGLTGVGQYEWSGPGPNSPNSIDASVWQDLPSGWYYFTITDNVCSASDSVYVDMLNPPVASFSADIQSGCNPLEVTFTNASQNASSYYFDFGNGNTATINDLSNQTQTFTSSTNVMLVALSSPTCGDTAYTTIAIVECGCTNPLALNYDPLAMVDDGSCILPVPIIIAPNVFTPNGDGANDLFFLDVTNQTSITLTVLNRWGNKMFESAGMNPAWNGKTEGGAAAEEGTYFYKYLVTGVDGSEYTGHGFLQLVRK
jgi:gliding motility-associated-like protein